MPRNFATLAEDQRAVEMQMLRETLSNVSGDNEQLLESLAQVSAMFAREDRGWSTLGFAANQDNGMTLEELKEWSEQIKNSQVGNPFIRRGLSLRKSYVWQSGIKYSNIPKPRQGAQNPPQNYIDHPQNQRNFFGPSARARREGALACGRPPRRRPASIRRQKLRFQAARRHVGGRGSDRTGDRGE